MIRWRWWCRSEGQKDVIHRACWITWDNKTRHCNKERKPAAV